MKKRTKVILIRCKNALINFIRSRNWGVFCFFLVFASIIWFGHALNSTRDQKLDIPIHYTGLNADVLFAEPLPEWFTIQVRDQGKRLRLYRNDTFTPIQIDLVQQTRDEQGKVQITAEAVRQKITDQLQGTTRLQRVLPEHISVSYYRQHQKRVPVRLVDQITLAPQYQFTQSPQLVPDSVTVYGAQETLQTLQEVFTEPLAEQMNDSLRVQLALQPLDGVRFAATEVEVTARAEPFTEKVFTLPIRIKDLPAGVKLRLFPPTVEATIRVGISHFNDVTEKDLQVECTYPTTQATQLPLLLRYTSPYITHGRISPTEVEYIIEKE